MKQCAQDGDSLNLEMLGKLYLEICKLLSQMGTVLRLAFADVKDKADTILKNQEFWCEGLSEDFLSMQEIADEEESSGVTHCNGENNADVCKVTHETHDWKRSYASTSRHLVRLWWFSSFMV